MRPERLDKTLVDRAFVNSRTQAQKLIEAGAVKIKLNGLWQCIQKPSTKIPLNSDIELQPLAELKYASRAGLKLEGALDTLCARPLFNTRHKATFFEGATVLDVGQSTGGFTDCLLQHACQRVVGVDVGQGQLVDSLRQHPAVVCVEGVNVRHCSADYWQTQAPSGFDWILMDVSFISQTHLHSKLKDWLKPTGYFLGLVKPQFELSAQQINKHGIVKNTEDYKQVEASVRSSLTQNGLFPVHYFKCQLLGGDGNQEFFVLASPIEHPFGDSHDT